MSELLNINPPELKFRFELRKNIPVTLSLHNPGTERVAFKVKTTSPKKYCVRPSSGFVEPGATKDVQVIMQAQREYPPSFQDCKDKFLVQCVKVGPETNDLNPDVFDGAKNSIKQTKLRVVLLGPPKPPSPVPEGVEEGSESAIASPKMPFKTPDDHVPAAAAAQPPLPPSVATAIPTDHEFMQITKDRDLLVGQVEGKAAPQPMTEPAVEAKSKVEPAAERVTASSGYQPAYAPSPVKESFAQKIVAKGGFTLIHLLLVAVLAFIIGHYT